MTHSNGDNSNRTRAKTGFSGGKFERSFSEWDLAHFSAAPIVHEIPDPRKGDRVCRGDGRLRLATRDSAQVPNLLFKPAPTQNQNSSALFKMTWIAAGGSRAEAMSGWNQQSTRRRERAGRSTEAQRKPTDGLCTGGKMCKLCSHSARV